VNIEQPLIIIDCGQQKLVTPSSYLNHEKLCPLFPATKIPEAEGLIWDPNLGL
jgi:hypothetical protein